MKQDDFLDNYDDETVADKLRAFVDKLEDAWGFVKKYRVAILVIALVGIAYTVIVSAYTLNISKQVNAYLDGKILLYQKTLSSFSVYAFKDGMVAKESWYCSSNEIYGDIEDFDAEYKISPKLFTDHIRIMEKADYSSYWSEILDVYLTESGEVQIHPKNENWDEWREIDAQEVFELRRKYTCDHAFGEYITTQVATCSKNGKRVATCSKCGYVDEESIERLAHNYKNKICTVCGAAKQPEKSKIEANTWYTYQDILHFQNIKLHNAYSTGQGRGMAVSYFFVCQHCHVVDEMLRTNVPEFNYSINKIFTCAECGGLTTVKIELG